MAKKRQKARIYRSKAPVETSSSRIPTWAWFTIGGLAAILLVIGLFFLEGQSVGQANAARGIKGARILPDPGAGHAQGDIDYSVPVPAGGPHNPIWQNCGIYEEPIRAENAIHSMEHGAVWIAYHPDLPAEDVEQLQELVRQERARLRTFYLLAPKPDLPAPIIATAWRAQIELESASDERLPEFMQRFHIGPFTPEQGATCSGGIGEPSL